MRREIVIKPVVFVGTSLEDLNEFPRDVQREIGYALHQAQIGEKHRKTKLLKGFSGVMEIRSDYRTNTYRAVYAAKIDDKTMCYTVLRRNLKGESQHLRRKSIS